MPLLSDAVLLQVMAVAPFAGAAIAFFLPTYARNWAATLAWSVAFTGLLCAILLYPHVTDGNVVRHEISWLPSLGVNLVLRLDGLAWLFAILVLGIGALVVLYARYYIAKKDPVARFFMFFLAFMGAMLGVIMAGNLVQLVVSWELTSLFSFLLIGYWHSNPSARDGARMALTVTATGGLCLLLGMLIIGRIVGSFDLDVVLNSGDAIRSSPAYVPALILVLLGALTKSAQFPFHFWLPRAMSAPTPVSAYLHSATMVKAGIFLMIRLWPVMSGTEAWYLIVGGAGTATLLVGAYSAIFQHDLKGLLAYSTISHLGLITVLLGLGSPLAAVAAIFHVVNHATFKASLFMAAGIIDHETGTRDLRRLSGLSRSMPITTTLAMVAAAAMAGVPLLNGFLSKEMFLAEAVANRGGHYLSTFLPVVATVASAFSVLYSLRFIHQAFFGDSATDLPHQPHEPPRWMRFPIEFLVLVCVAVGTLPALTIAPFLASAVVSVLGTQTPEYSLAIWHGFNAPLIMSLIALVGGVALYVVFRGSINTNPRGGPLLLSRFDGGIIFDKSLALFYRLAGKAEEWFSTERLQWQLRCLILCAMIAAFLSLEGRGLAMGDSFEHLSAVDPVFVLLWVIGCTCAIGAAWSAKYHRLAATVLMGGAGLVSCLTFVWLSAPDLALTQLVVEIVTTVLLLLGLRWLPKRQETIPVKPENIERMRRRRVGDFMIAIASGSGLAVLSYAVMTRPLGESIAHFFLERSYADGGGRNVVNVLLVDFRAFDTMGEITVLGIVGLTVFALLRRFRPATESLSLPKQQQIQNDHDRRNEQREVGSTLSDTMLIPRVIMKWLYPVIIVLAVHLFLRGHDQPGGGFVAGITMSIAVVLLYMASGARWVEERLDIHPLLWIGLGLLIAGLAGAGSWLFGYPFLTSWFRYVDFPVLGKLPLASAVVFDAGVFILVVGATVLTLVALAHQSLRKPRERAAKADSATEEDGTQQENP